MWIYEGGQWRKPYNTIDKKMSLAIEDIQLWREEAQFDVDRGVDWVGVLGGSKALRNELERVLRPYYEFFDDIRIESIEEVGERISVTIIFKAGDEAKTAEVTI